MTVEDFWGLYTIFMALATTSHVHLCYKGDHSPAWVAMSFCCFLFGLAEFM